VCAEPQGPWGVLLGRMTIVVGSELLVDIKGAGNSARVYSLPLYVVTPTPPAGMIVPRKRVETKVDAKTRIRRAHRYFENPLNEQRRVSRILEPEYTFAQEFKGIMKRTNRSEIRIQNNVSNS
jgi:hypothetical protein